MGQSIFVFFLTKWYIAYRNRGWCCPAAWLLLFLHGLKAFKSLRMHCVDSLQAWFLLTRLAMLSLEVAVRWHVTGLKSSVQYLYYLARYWTQNSCLHGKIEIATALYLSYSESICVYSFQQSSSSCSYLPSRCGNQYCVTSALLRIVSTRTYRRMGWACYCIAGLCGVR